MSPYLFAVLTSLFKGAICNIQPEICFKTFKEKFKEIFLHVFYLLNMKIHTYICAFWTDCWSNNEFEYIKELVTFFCDFF